MKKLVTLALLSGGFLTALGANSDIISIDDVTSPVELIDFNVE